jgi:hypothetical protein
MLGVQPATLESVSTSQRARLTVARASREQITSGAVHRRSTTDSSEEPNFLDCTWSFAH